MQVEAPVYNIYYDNQLDAVVMEWSGYATSSQFKSGTDLMLRKLIEHGSHNVLAAIKDMVIIGLDDQRWLESVILPQAITHGFKFLTIVRPDNYFNKVAVESISYKVDKEKLSISFFDSLEDAREWLQSLK